MCRKLTQGEFENKFYLKYPNKFTVIGKYMNAITPLDIRCNTCGFIISQTPNHYDKGKTKCPICNKNSNTVKTFVGINDMWTTNPDVAVWLSNPNDGYKYRINTEIKLDFICPNCGKHRMSRPNKLKNGFICHYCSDNIKYPNKLMAHILDLCNIKFDTEYHFINSLYRYDFHFILNNVHYLVEMDGGYGHGNVDTRNRTKSEQLLIDEIKNRLAKKNNFTLIRIDCNYNTIETRYEYICNSIMNSKLRVIIGLTPQILLEADKLSQKNQLIKFSDCWKNGINSYDKLFEIFHVNSRGAIRNYAKRAIDCGFLDISYNDFLKQVRIASNHKMAKTRGIPVMCEQTGEIFDSIAEAKRKMNVPALGQYFKENRKYCGRLPDGTHLNWKKINNVKIL